MIISTTDHVAGRETVETIGLVRGSTVRARNVGRDIVAGLRNIVGGEVTEYTKLMADAREQAIARMVAEAEGLGADAVVSTRLITASVAQGSAEIVAYGTAVRLG